MRKFLLAFLTLVATLCVGVACGGGKGGTDGGGQEGMDHPHEYEVDIQDPTCMGHGVKRYHCWCGHGYDETIEPLGHEWMEATCEHPSTCERCGETTGDVGLCQIETFEEVSPATCKQNKVEGGNCIWCGTFEEREVENSKLPHDFSVFWYENSATCLSNASIVYECSYGCGESDEVEQAGTQLEHSYTDVYTPYEQPATCTENKVIWHNCDNDCGVQWAEEIEESALGHDIARYDARQSDCDLVGWDAYEKCRRCEHSTYQESPALAHNYEDGVCTNCHYYEPTDGLLIRKEYSDKHGCEVAYVYGEDNFMGAVDLVIPATYEGAPVVGIDEGAFLIPFVVGQTARYWVTSLVIPKYMEVIGEGAFSGRDEDTMQKVELFGTPTISGIKTNSVYADSLETFLSVEINEAEAANGVKWGDIYIDGEKLTNVVIPSTIKNIGHYAFAYSSIESVEIPSTCKSIGSYAFGDCSRLVDLEIADGVEEIGKYAFWFTSIEEVVVPGSIKEVSEGAFSSIHGITSIEIKEGVKIIGDGAFSGPMFSFSLQNVILANSIEVIGKTAFDYSYGEVMETELILPASLKKVGWHAFTSWQHVKKIVIPETLEVVEERAFDQLGEKAEGYCINIHIPSVEKYLEIDFQNWRYGSIPGLACSGWNTFYVNGEAVTKLVIPKTTTEITDGRFSVSAITEVVIHKDVVKLDANFAFQHTKVQTIYYEGTEEEWNAIVTGEFTDPWIGSIEIVYNYVAE